MATIDSIVKLATIGLVGYVFLRAFPLAERYFGGAAAAPSAGVVPDPTGVIAGGYAWESLGEYEKFRAAEEAKLRVWQEEIITGSVIPGSPIGVGQEEYARPDAQSLLLQLLAQTGTQQAAPADTGPPAVPDVGQRPAPRQQDTFLGIGIAPIVWPPAPAVQQAAPIEQGPSDTWEAGRVVGTGVTGGRAYERVATGFGKGTTTIWL